MKKGLLSLSSVLIAGTMLRAQTVLFSQNFSSSANVGDYVTGGSASGNLFDGIGNAASNGGGTTAIGLINTGAFEIQKSGTGNAGFTRNNFYTDAGLTSAPTVIEYSMDINNIRGTDASIDTAFALAYQLSVGQDYNSGYGLVNSTHINTVITFNLTSDGKITFNFHKDSLGNTQSPSAYSAGTLRWFINNTSGGFNYTAPDGSVQYIGADSSDLWINNDLAGNNIPQSNAAGTVHLSAFRLTTNGKYDDTLDMDNISIVVPEVIAVPVKLTSFTAVNAGAQNHLEWTTASEQNNSHFDITRSADGKNFITIGTVQGHGTTGNSNQYTYTDYHPLKGISYYQLAQVDFDGNVSKSGIVSVMTGSETSNIKVYIQGSTVNMNISSGIWAWIGR